MLSDKRAAAVALRHSLYMMPMGVAAPLMGLTTWHFGPESLLINGYMAYHAYGFYSNPKIRTAKQLFRTSLWHLPALLTLMAVHKISKEEEVVEGSVDISADGAVSGSGSDWGAYFTKACTRYAISEIANGPSK